MNQKVARTFSVGICMILLLFTCFGAGCSQAANSSGSTSVEDPKDPIVGTWTMTEVSTEGIRYTAEEYQRMVVNSFVIPTLEFFEDGSVYISELNGGSGQAEWETIEEGSAYRITDVTGTDIDVKITKGQLLLKVGGNTHYFERG